MKCLSDFCDLLLQINRTAEGTREALIYSYLVRSKGHDLDGQLAFQVQAVCGTSGVRPVGQKQV